MTQSGPRTQRAWPWSPEPRLSGSRARERAPASSAWLTGCPLILSRRGGHSTEAAAHRPEGGGDKNAEEDSITRLSEKPGPDDSWPTSASQDFDFGTKNVPKPRIAKLLHSSWQFMKNSNKTWHCETRRWNLI
ncbi:uncharacterized protein LOC132677559 [Panthera onca]